MATTNAELLVNGKAVARRLFTCGMSPGERLYRLSFDWDTRGIPPGEYRIGAQAFVWEDASPSDNRLDVTQPVVVASPGGGFPGGEAAGGSATETDPRFGKSGSADNVVSFSATPRVRSGFRSGEGCFFPH
jgi:hypothetical protein